MTEETTTLTKAIVEATPSDAEGERAAAVVEKAIETDPVLQNALSQERWWQSGIQWFGSGGAITALGFLITEFSTNGADFNSYNWGVVASSTMSLIATVGVLYRRFMPGLKPFFWQWTQK